VVLQRWTRHWMAHWLDRQTEASMRIQQALRRWQCRREQAATKVQRSWLRWCERCRWRRWHEKQQRKRLCHAAAVCIQCQYRLHVTRQTDCRARAASRLSHAWRAVVERRARAHAAKCTAAALLIQRIVRGMFCRNRLEQDGVLVAHKEQADTRWDIVSCNARRQMQRQGFRALRADGWRLVVSAGGPEHSPLWRAVLEVTAEEAIRHIASSGLHDLNGLRGLPSVHMARALLDSLVVNLSNGQLVLHIAAKDPEPKINSPGGQEPDIQDAGRQESDIQDSGLSDTNDVPSTTASEGAHCGGSPSKQHDPDSPRAACPLWSCAQCGLNNEVSPDVCVLCDSKRAPCPSEPGDAGQPVRAPEAQPQAPLSDQLSMGRCASDTWRRLSQTARHGPLRVAGTDASGRHGCTRMRRCLRRG